MAVRRGRRDVDKEKFWVSAFERFGNSGQTQKKFCEQEHLSEKVFGYWLRQYRQGKLTNGLKPQEAQQQSAVQQDVFVPVRIAERQPSNRTKAPIEIFTPQGFVVRVPLDADDDVLASVLAALSRLAC